MAVATITQFVQSQLTTAFVTYYTVPALTTSIIKDIVISNTGASVRTYTIAVVPSAGAAGVANQLFSAVSIGPGETQLWQLSTVMAAGGFISMLQAVGTDLTVTISGVQVA